MYSVYLSIFSNMPLKAVKLEAIGNSLAAEYASLGFAVFFSQSL